MLDLAWLYNNLFLNHFWQQQWSKLNLISPMKQVFLRQAEMYCAHGLKTNHMNNKGWFLNKLINYCPPYLGLRLRERRLQNIRNNTNLILTCQQLVYQALNQNVPVAFIVVISPTTTAVTVCFSLFLATHLCWCWEEEKGSCWVIIIFNIRKCVWYTVNSYGTLFSICMFYSFALLFLSPSANWTSSSLPWSMTLFK